MVGRIVQLEVDNFKSYKGHQVIGPFTDFTAVIGPNGAGKSNLMDAISFVLGVRTAQLRGTQLKELIYNNSDRDASKASVMLVYKHDSDGDEDEDEDQAVGDSSSEEEEEEEGDSDSDSDSAVDAADNNKKKKVGAKVAASGAAARAKARAALLDDNDEIRFQRIVQASGSCTYKINERTVGYAAYDAALASLNILVATRNFLVFQGDIESITNKSAKELTRYFEQVSGSAALKSEYERLQKERDAAVEQTQFTHMNAKGMRAEKVQFEAQKEEAERYTQLRAELTTMEREHVLWQLYHVERDLESAAGDIATNTAQLDEWRAEKEAADARAAKKREELGALQAKKLASDKEIRALRATAEAARPAAIKVREALGHMQKRARTSRREHAKLDAECTKKAAEIAALEAELEGVQLTAAQFAAQQQEAAEVTLSAAEMAEYSRIKQLAGQQTAAVRAQAEQLRRQQRLAAEECNTAAAAHGELQQRRTQLAEKRAVHVDKRDSLDGARREGVAQQQALAVELTDFRRAFQEAKAAQVRATERLGTVNEKLREAKATQRATERGNKFEESLRSLKRLFPGVYGRIVDLCTPRAQKYEVAVTVAMGGFMDAIVVDTQQTALECIQYLKEQREGVATFLPLDAVQAPAVDESLRRLGAHVKLVLDVVKYEPFVEQAVLHVCGNTIVCDDVSQARKLCYGGRARRKAVTLDGAVLRKSGLMTAGVSGIASKARRWNEKEVVALKQQKATHTKALAAAKATLRTARQEKALVQRMSTVENRVATAAADIAALQAKIDALDAEMATLDAQLAEAAPRVDALRAALTAREDEMGALDARLTAIEDDVFREQLAAQGSAATAGVSTMREFEETHVKAAVARQEQQLRYTTLQSQLESQLAFHRHRDLETPRAKLADEIASLDEQIAAAKQEERTLKAAAKTAADALNKAEKQNAAIKAMATERQGQLKQLKTAVATHIRRIGEVQKRITASETWIEQSHEHRRSMLQRCRVEEISLPLVGGATSTQQAGGASQASQQRPQSSQSSQSQDADDVELDFSDVKHKNATSQQRRDAVNAQYTQKLAALSTQMESLAPNLKAIDKFKDVLDRYRTSNDQFGDARKRTKKATDAFNAVAKQRRDLFMAAFDHISGAIDAVYKELTTTDGVVGGSAYLTVESRTEPFLHGVKYNAVPPMKRFRDMEQLSGGEKTVAALALLFAVHSFRPSPFFVLDEVDAALDPVNVQRVSDYVRAKSGASTQCIVISLKDAFFEKADSLVGIYRQVESADVAKATPQQRWLSHSRTATLDLRHYR